MPTKEVVPSAPAGVPDLVATPATSIGAEDIAIPRLYIGQGLSEAVQSRLVQLGDIYAAYGADDADPQVLDQPIRIHPLHMRKSKSYVPAPGAPLETFEWDDPSAPEKADTVYNFTFFLPDVDPDIPFKMAMTRSSSPAARKILTALLRNATAGPAWVNAFELSSDERKGDKGRYHVAVIRNAEAKPDDIKAAAVLGEIVLRGEAQRESNRRHHSATDQPEI